MEPNIVDVEEVPNIMGKGIGDTDQDPEDGNFQQENFAKFMEYFESLNRNDKRKLMNKRQRCRRLHTRVGTKRWLKWQANNRKLQCKS